MEGKRGVLRHDRVEDDVLARARLTEDPEISREAFGQREACLLVEEDRKPDGRRGKGVRGALYALLAERPAQHSADEREAPCPSCHVDTRHVGPGYVAAVSGRVVQDTGEDLDRLLDEWRTGRVDVIDPARERRPAGRGEVDQEAARVWP